MVVIEKKHHADQIRELRERERRWSKSCLSLSLSLSYFYFYFYKVLLWLGHFGASRLCRRRTQIFFQKKKKKRVYASGMNFRRVLLVPVLDMSTWPKLPCPYNIGFRSGNLKDFLTSNLFI